MDSQGGRIWLLVIHLAAFIPVQAIDIPTGDRLWITHNKEYTNPTPGQLLDVTLPKRAATTGDVLSPLKTSNQFLEFTKRRHNPQEVRYELTAFGKNYVFVLKPERRFISPSFTVEHFSGNQSSLIPCGSDLSHCYYRGSVLGDPVSSAVFDLCSGLRGAFKTSDGVYLVQPLAHSTAPGLDDFAFGLNGRRHLIINHLATAPSGTNHSHCGMDEKALMNRTQRTFGSTGLHPIPGVNTDRHGRAKRETIFQGAQSYPRYVELMITADKTMLDHYGSEFEVKRYLQTIMGVVHDIFLDPKIGNSIEVVLTGIKILKNEEDLNITSDARKSLRAFCLWQYKQNVGSDSEAGHYDTAVLITRKNICRTKGNCETLGLAQLGTMCDPEKSCSIVEDNGIGVAFTIAHELGHVFNIGHDEMSRKCLGERNGLHVMAPALNLQAVPWSWSSCSRKEITEFLERGHDRCLMDKPQYQFKKSAKRPGEVYGPDMQCKLTYGKDSKICRLRTRSCRRLWCAVKFPNGLQGCRTHAMPWAEGSPCGRGKWCIRGKCVPKRTHSKVNGGWSAWTPFGPCSRTCGGGVAFSSRVCNNPSPSNGGQYCLGAKKRFKSCRTQDCPKDTPNFREVQCAAYNGKRGPKGSKWVPRYAKGRHQCQLICERVGGGGFVTAKVIDGTKCEENKFDICVNGICRLAGCDNVLNSQAKIDECGVCGGRNTTCERIYKTWHKKVRWGYNDVTTFYPGYSSIRIEQITPRAEVERSVWSRRGDDNYLVLLDENYGNILNSGFFIKSESKIKYEALGLQITYSGSRNIPEFIRIDGRLTRKIYLQILSVEKVLAPKITYSYLSPIKAPEKFIWDRKGTWSKCSRDCQGQRKRRLVCKRERDGLLVSSSHCNAKKKPRSMKENCNTHCLFKWMVAGRGTCRPGCGPGFQKIYYKCVKHDIKTGANLVQGKKRCRLVTKPRSERPCNGTCDNVLWVYSRWTECSRSCDGGLQTRKVKCVEKVAHVRKEMPLSMCSRFEKRSLKKPCNTQRCPIWRTGKWGRCSAPCGEGYQRRRVVCVWKGNKSAKDNACDQKTKPKERQNCRIKACPHWEYQEWSDCSATCGTGHEIRLVRCVDGDGRALKDEDCRGVEKPISRRRCSGLPQCDTTVFLTRRVTRRKHVKWTAGEWGECSGTCGKGHQERHVSCIDLKARVLNNDLCKHITKPPTVQDCFRYCGNWRYSDWTPCSSGCGRGTQRRQVKCFSRDYRLTDDKNCDPLLRPPNIRQCSNYFCAPAAKRKPKTSGRWKTGPWSKCSRTCEGGVRQRSVICLDGSSVRDYSQKSCIKSTKPESVTSCNLGPCPRWKTKRWSRCSKSCGFGTVSRDVYCVNDRSVLKDEKCNKKLKPAVRKSCFDRTCPSPFRWVKGKWKPCSVKCGVGVKKRDVWCGDNRGRRHSPVYCRNLRRKPKSEKRCRRAMCGIWETGLWGECSARCGIGEKVRSVRCRRRSSFPGDHFCASKNRPINKKQCHMRHCRPNQYKWFTTQWGACSTTCGNGVRSHMVICVNEREVQVSDSNCDPATKPPKTVTCETKECPPEWVVGDWSECSKSCDVGVQIRSVTCPEKDNRFNDLCDEKKKPATKRRCNRGFCTSYYIWKTGPWSKCSATCGEATMRRAVKCLGRNNYYGRDARCFNAGINKPETYRKCRVPLCIPRTCRDIQARLGKQKDGEFIITINNKKIKVFCHGMLTDHPKEYITLPAGPEHNFAEYYHRTLRNPNECPYNGARNDNCPKCHKQIFPSSGGSYFSRVRLDISRMSIVGNDYTFAVRRGNHWPVFGTAGDCYSKTHCPQGRFGIDLTNTGLSLSPDVTWRSYGYHLSKQIDIHKGRQIITGMCGGYCGVCRPYRSLRVTVQW